MTREEITQRGLEKFPQDIIEEINDDGTIARIDTNANRRKIYIQGLIDNNPIMSSNLDEAAENCTYRHHAYARESFKEGAEWMAEQGVVLNLSIDELSCDAYNACVEQGLTSEDDVIIQIRKK